jgi:hypothetical protein
MAFFLNAYCCRDVKTPVNTDDVISYNYGIDIVGSSASFTRNILIGRNEKKIYNTESITVLPFGLYGRES